MMMTPLLQPADCCVLLIDPRLEWMDRLDPSAQKTLAQNFDLVERAVQAAAVPIHVAFRDLAPDPQRWLTGSHSAAPGAVHNLGDGGSSWSDSSLAVALAGQTREALILCGFWIETSVTFIALPALASGFDVFIIMDATPARVEDARRAAVDRLLQAGAVPTTTRQLVAEWIEVSAVVSQRSALSLLLPTD
jgi:Isochorismatase family